MTTIDRGLVHARATKVTLLPRPGWVPAFFRYLLAGRIGRWLYHFLALSLLAVFLTESDNLAVGAALRTTLNRAVAQLETWLKPPPADSDVTIVLWTDNSLAGLMEEGIVERPWPIEYAAHGMLVATLADMQPKALFLDFAFITERKDGGLDDFVAAIRYAAIDRGIPVVISCVPGRGTPAFDTLRRHAGEINRQIRERWHEARGAGATTLDGEPLPTEAEIAARGVHFVSAALNEETVAQTYPLRSSSCEAGGGAEATVAPTLYNTVLGAAASRRRIDVGDPSMSLIFDTRVHPATREFFRQPDDPGRCQANVDPTGPSGTATDAPQPEGRAQRGLLDLVVGLIFDPERLRLPRAGPPMLPADAVIYEHPDKEGAGGPEICRRPMRDFLAGRVVMIGSNLTAADDFRDTLVDRAQPGVLIHATAFQNLMQFGARYPRTQVVVGSGDGRARVPASWFVYAFVVILSVMHADFLRRREKVDSSAQLRFDSDVDSGAVAGFLAFCFLPTLAAFVFAMNRLDVHVTEMLFVAVTLQIVRAPLGVSVPNTLLMFVMYRSFEQGHDSIAESAGDDHMA